MDRRITVNLYSTIPGPSELRPRLRNVVNARYNLEKPMAEKQSHPGDRDSKTGQFVTEKYAKSHPKTTQKESIPNPGKGDTGRGKKK
jgi:hypothetical protein